MSRFGDWIDRKIDAASTCPECGCGYDRWVPNCTCMRDDCSCSGAEERPDEEADEEPIRINWPTRQTNRPRDAERWYREVADLRADADAERDPDKARALRETADRLDRDPENPRNRSDHRGTSEDTRSAQPPQLTDAQVEHLSQAVDRAFAERDRMWDVYRETGRAQDERAMEAQDRHAARLLDQYNAACQAQRAESDRRRDVNVARHGRDEAVKQGDLAEAMQGDDWLEDHGMHADERATCHQCQSWADHAHDQITNERITLEQWEGRGSDDDPPDSSSAAIDMPPPAGPYQPPTKPSPSPNTPRPSAEPTTTPGAAMTSAVSYGSLKARVLGIADNTLEHQGTLQQAVSGLETLIADVQSATEESEALAETLQMLMQAKQQCEEALGMVGQANNSATNAAAGLQ